MSLESALSSAAFDAFSVTASLNSSDVSAIVDKGVEVEDFDGNVRRVDFLVHLLASVSWSRSDILTDPVYGALKLGDKVTDDGFIVKVSAVKYQ